MSEVSHDTNNLSDEDRMRLGAYLRSCNMDAANAAHPRPSVNSSVYAAVVKRILDVAIATPALIVSLPINLVLAILTYRDVGSPILFHQDRVGKNGKTFRITKFRSMTYETDKRGNLLPGDQRVTSLGKKLRATSLDELFNFWNILKGDMSVIGPRPLLPEYTDRYCDYHATRLAVKPGLECPSHEHVEHALSWEEQFNNDAWYASHVSFVTDIKLIGRMVQTVFNKKQTAARGAASRSFFMGYDTNGKALGLPDVPSNVLNNFDHG